MYVEDKVSHQGPFYLKVTPKITVKNLKELVEREYEIPIGVQRWIIANKLAGDDSATLESLNVNTNGFPVFLYLVAPGMYYDRNNTFCYGLYFMIYTYLVD